MNSTPVIIGSWNATPAADRAASLVSGGTHLLDSLVEGVSLVEDDPEEMSVGYGGLPNEDCTVELDAAVFDGELHRAGAVAALRGVRHAAAVALQVLRRTDHALLAGEGALQFARRLGFKEEDLLTSKSRQAWLDWRANVSTRDAWLESCHGLTVRGQTVPAGETQADAKGDTGKAAPKAPFTYGTIHVSGLAPDAHLHAVTSTSGLSYKIAGRVGDSPILGSGLYVDDAVGSAGATGRGEATMHHCASYEVVRRMEAGLDPTRACLESLRRIAAYTREPRLLRAPGIPTFNVTLYALRKDGQAGAASLQEGSSFILHSSGVTKMLPAAFLFAK